MDHCTVTLAEFKTDTRLLVLHEAEMWSATTFEACWNCSASPVKFVTLRLNASKRSPLAPGVVDLTSRRMEEVEARNGTATIRQFKLGQLLPAEFGEKTLVRMTPLTEILAAAPPEKLPGLQAQAKLRTYSVPAAVGILV